MSSEVSPSAALELRRPVKLSEAMLFVTVFEVATWVHRDLELAGDVLAVLNVTVNEEFAFSHNIVVGILDVVTPTGVLDGSESVTKLLTMEPSVVGCESVSLMTGLMSFLFSEKCSPGSMISCQDWFLDVSLAGVVTDFVTILWFRL